MEGGQRHEELSYPDEQIAYFIAADRFGWTPTEVDEQPAYLMDWIMAISDVYEEVRNKVN